MFWRRPDRAGNNQAIGRRGEIIARRYLEQRGLKFLAANWCCRCTEVDLIMADQDSRVFVEVRSRSQTQYGTGLETVAAEKQRKLLRTARHYQQQVGYWRDIRLDLVSITWVKGAAPEIEYIEHAFTE